MVTYKYAYMTYIVSPLAGLGGGISWRPPAYSLLVILHRKLLLNLISTHMKQCSDTVNGCTPRSASDLSHYIRYHMETSGSLGFLSDDDDDKNMGHF